MIKLIYKVIEHTYQKCLSNRLAEYSSRDLKDILKEITTESNIIFSNNQALILDIVSKVHIKIASLIQASYFVLLKEHNNKKIFDKKPIDKEIIIEILKDALLTTFQRYLATPMGLAVNILRSNLIKVLNILPIKLLNNIIFGKGFAILITAKDADKHEFIYNSCLYNQFFTKNSTPELTQIVCHSDRAWIDVINSSKYPIQFQRPSTLANGQDSCIFRFVKLQNKINKIKESH